MQGNISRVVRFGAGLLALASLGWVLTGRAAGPLLEGYPTDWTHRHVIFSQPATAGQAERLAQDPRYWQQWYRLNVVRVLTPEAERSAEMTSGNYRDSAASSPHSDWSQDMGLLPTPPAAGGIFPAKYSFGITTANCGNATTPDFVVFSTAQVGASGQASIVAYDNLYGGCPTGTIPSVYWAYNTGGQIETSPVLSRDGSQIAFVQTSGGLASLVLLKWKASTTETVSSPGTLVAIGPAAYPTCTAPCMTTIALTDGSKVPTADTTSSVFYDYVGDTAWVGDSRSWLHQFTPVFNGTATIAPGEVRNTTWPVQLNPADPLPLSSPVHDHVSGYVFAGDQGGYLYSVYAATGAVVQSGQIDHGVGIVAGPIADISAKKVYVFVSNDGSGACAGGTPCAGVIQFAPTFAATTTGTEIAVGQSSSPTPNPLYDGAFDALYQSSVNATGNLYVCGNTGLSPILYRVPIAAGVWGTPSAVATLTLAADHVACSPVTDILNPNVTGGPAEKVFFGVVDHGHPTNCAAGCAMSFVSTPWQASTTYQIGQELLVVRPQNHVSYISVATTNGTTGTTAPDWPTTADTITTDGTVKWINQGATTVTPLADWVGPGHVYATRARVLDSNGNVEIAEAGGTSGAGATWATAPGATTFDGGVTWFNGGPWPNASLAAAGGTSGIIMDNTVETLTGASQVYFSTLNNQACGTTGTGSCAVQASQSALQ